MPSRQLPAVVRGLVIEGWPEFQRDGRFGSVSEERMRQVIAVYERGHDPTDDFARVVFALCDKMVREFVGIEDVLSGEHTDVWHASVAAEGNMFDEDRLGRNAAKGWVTEKLNALGYGGSILWTDSEDVSRAQLGSTFSAWVHRR